MSNSLDRRIRGKYISKRDAKLIIDSTKKSNLEIVRTIIVRSLWNPPNTPSLHQFKRKFTTQADGLTVFKTNMRFVLKNFAGVFGKISKTRIGDFRFSLEHGYEKGNMLALNLVKGTSEAPSARLNIGFRFTKDKKPVLVVINFQGLNKERIEEFSKTVNTLGFRKKKISAFRFMLETVVSATRKKMRVEAKDPKTLAYIYPDERVTISKLIKQKKLLQEIVASDLEGRAEGESRLMLPEKRTPEETQIIAREKTRITTVGYKMHRTIFDQIGFKKTKKKKRKSVLVLRRKPV